MVSCPASDHGDFGASLERTHRPPCAGRRVVSTASSATADTLSSRFPQPLEEEVKCRQPSSVANHSLTSKNSLSDFPFSTPRKVERSIGSIGYGGMKINVQSRAMETRPFPGQLGPATAAKLANNSMQHLGSFARGLALEIHSEFHLTKQKGCRVESIELTRNLREHGQQELAFHSRPFVLCGLPVRRPPAGMLRYTRRNGRFVLEIIAHPDYGLPFGQDRLIPLWFATLAVRQMSKTTQFQSAAEILEEFDLPRDGPHYKRLEDGFKRVFSSTIYFGSELTVGRNQLWDFRRFHFFDQMQIWYAKEGATLRNRFPDGNVVVLSQPFWEESKPIRYPSI